MPDPRETRLGVLYALAAFLFWGLTPLYFKAMSAVAPLELLAHRVVWVLLLLLPLLALLRPRQAQGGWRAVLAALGERRSLLLLLASTALISVNWFAFIWGAVSERVLEISLGYYVNPLVNILLGVVFLRERLGAWQWLAVALAAFGVANLAVEAEGVPWVSLTLAFSFGVYALIRKTASLPSVEGLFLETLLLAPLALGYLVFLADQGLGHFTMGSPTLDLLIVASGVVTALPLIWFTSAARRLNLSTVAFFQYLAPTCHLLLAVFAFGEPFTASHLVTFSCIWLALVIVTASGLRAHRRRLAAAE